MAGSAPATLHFYTYTSKRAEFSARHPMSFEGARCQGRLNFQPSSYKKSLLAYAREMSAASVPRYLRNGFGRSSRTRARCWVLSGSPHGACLMKGAVMRHGSQGEGLKVFHFLAFSFMVPSSLSLLNFEESPYELPGSPLFNVGSVHHEEGKNFLSVPSPFAPGRALLCYMLTRAQGQKSRLSWHFLACFVGAGYCWAAGHYCKHHEGNRKWSILHLGAAAHCRCRWARRHILHLSFTTFFDIAGGLLHGPA